MLYLLCRVAQFRALLKTISWIPVCYKHLMGTSRVNSFILYKWHQGKGDRYTQLEYTQQLCIELCEGWIQQKAREVAAGDRASVYKTLKEWQGDFNSRRFGNHFCVERRTYFDQFNSVTKQQKFITIRNRCIICSSMTSNCCKACGDVYLCNYTDNKYLSCAEWFHTVRDITTARPLLDGTVDPNHVSKYFP